jgi:hypothetical protein
MDDFQIVEREQPVNHLVKNGPNFRFLHLHIGFLETVDFCLKVASIGVLHDDAQRGRRSLEKCFFVASDVGMLHGR